MRRLSRLPVAAASAEQPLVDGPAGWWVVGAAFLSMYTVFGVTYSFSAFFRSMANEFGIDRGRTAFFFALTTFLYFVFGVVSGKVADRIGPRPVLIFGAVSMVLGLLATSRVDNLYVGYLTYSIGVGIGVACGYVPMLACVGGWFAEKRTTAMGFAVAGVGLGTLVNAPLAERLIERYGWRQTYVIMAVGAGVLMSIAALGAKRPPAAGVAGVATSLTETIKTSRPFWLLYISMFVFAFPLFMPFVFMTDYMKEQGSDRSAGLLLGLIGLASIVGRLGLGRLAARTKPLALYQGSILVMGLSFALWFVAGPSYGLLLAFAVVMGVSYGGFIALAPAVAADIWGPAGLGGLLGLLYTGAGLGGLVGPPVMGRAIDSLGYRPALVLAMVLGVFDFALLLPVGAATRRGGPDQR
ncbi:MAG: MFS transporter [Actinomycetota bacterium]|nr:MFS transporter [Actinomycetota bacterium]